LIDEGELLQDGNKILMS